MKVEIEQKHFNYLMTIVGFDQKIKTDRMMQAASNRTKYDDPDLRTADEVLQRLREASFDSLVESAKLKINIGTENEAANKKKKKKKKAKKKKAR